MCGFAGYAGLKNHDHQVIVDMTEKIRHRGPDSQGYFEENGAALGFARLSIIDLEGGSQPMFNEDKSLVLVFNGELYNFQDVRKELIEAGHVFATGTDSEILLHGYEEWGKEGLLSKLRGMFAFVIYDRNRKSIFGARDHFGIKPFYYYKGKETLLFGSEIKSFLVHPEFEKKLNEGRLPDFMTFGCLPGDETFFTDVYKLLPGHYLIWENGQLEINQYWEPVFRVDENQTNESVADRLDAAISESVDKHIIADVPFGSFLSSGVDSSYIAYELKKRGDLTTYTIDFEDKKYSEAAHAKELADELGAENYTKVVTADSYIGDAEKIQYYMDEPLANPSANLLYYVSQRAVEDYKVILSGEGADEMFGGYRIYHEVYSLHNYQKLPKALRKALAAIVKPLPDFRGKGFITRGSKSVEERYIGNSNVFKYGERDEYLKKSYPSRNPYDIAMDYYKKAPELDDVTKMQYLDFFMWLRQEILLKADKMTMANSLELRVPFMDIEIFKVANTIPSKCKISEDNTKIAFRTLADRKFSKKSAERKKLMFPSPLPAWLREDKYYNIIKKEFEGDIAAMFFEQDRILQLLEDHKNGVVSHSVKVWLIYTFIMWYKAYFVNNGDLEKIQADCDRVTA